MENSGELRDKRPVKSIELANELYRFASATTTLLLRREYHGTYDTWWVAVLENGVEIERHNLQHVQTLAWAEEPATPAAA